jgi:pimeloyl-ACP methyl ester carboxylesterase
MLRAFADGQLFGEVLGDLPARVIGLHGWRRDRHDLEPALRGLDAVSLDLPGFGASPIPPTAWGSHEYGALVNEALPEIAGRPVVVVAHSFGGRVAVCAAAARPDLYAGLVLTGVPLLRRAGAVKVPRQLRLARRLHKWRLVSAARVEELREKFGSDDYKQATGVMRDIFVRLVNESYDAELSQLACPVRMVWGADDTAAPTAMAADARALCKDATLDTLPGVGHDVPRQATDRLRATIDTLVTTSCPE